MFYVTRKGDRIAGSIAVPYASAVQAARLLNREYRTRDEFDVEPASDWDLRLHLTTVDVELDHCADMVAA